jgi:hypothetical protein
MLMKEIYKVGKDEEEGVSSYRRILRKRQDTGIQNKKASACTRGRNRFGRIPRM